MKNNIIYTFFFLQEYAKRGRNIYNKWISENGNGMNHANVKEYGDLMKILGLMIFAGLQLLCIGYLFRAQFVESLNYRRVNA